MNSQHTPGPWIIGPAHGIFTASGETFICNYSLGRASSPYVKIRHEEAANAKLIAAAPELLEALIDILPYLKAENTNGNHWVSMVEQAIKKATE